MGLLAAQEADDRCYRSRLIKTPDRISERPPRGGLSVFRSEHLNQINAAGRPYAAPNVRFWEWAR
jgi:hypothetical protein